METPILPKVNTGPNAGDNNTLGEEVENRKPNKDCKGKNHRKGSDYNQEVFGSQVTSNVEAEPNQIEEWEQQTSRKERKGVRKKVVNERDPKTPNKKRKVCPVQF